jgi:hypothetical protein
MIALRRPARLLLALLLPCVLFWVATACSSGGDQKGAAASTTSTVPGPPRTVGGKADGYSIQIPATWKDIAINPAALQRTLVDDKGSGQLDDGLKRQIRTLAGTGGKLLVYDDTHRTTNINVLRVAAQPGQTTATLAAGLPNQLAQLIPPMRDVKVETVNLASGPAVRATGTQAVPGANGVAANLFQIQYYVLSGPDMYICILATDDPARDQAKLETIGPTFTVVR